MSSPHFYQGDEKFVRAVFGMRPHKEYHQTFIDLNPVRDTVHALLNVLSEVPRLSVKLLSFKTAH